MHTSCTTAAYWLRQGGIQALFLRQGFDPAKHLISRNALDLPRIDFPSLALDFLKPCCLDIRVWWVVQFFEEGAQHFLFFLRREPADLFLNYGNWTGHDQTVAMQGSRCNDLAG